MVQQEQQRQGVVVGLGVAGVKYMEGKLPPHMNIQLVPISPEGPLDHENVEKIDFLIASGIEYPPKRMKEIFDTAKQLKVVQTMSAGVNAIQHMVPEGVMLCNASGCHDIAVAEWCMGVMLAQLRQLPAFWTRQQEGVWEPATRQIIQSQQPDVGIMDDLEDKEVLILGHGSIGRALEARLAPFGARVRGIVRTPRPGLSSMADLPELLPGADVVVVLLPLTPETRHIVDADFLTRMKPGALLVNAGRGPQVDTAALVAALHSGHVRAALDVTDPEPLPPGHPLWKAPGLLLTPHIGGAVVNIRVRGYRFVLKQIERYISGQPLENVRLHGY